MMYRNILLVLGFAAEMQYSVDAARVRGRRGQGQSRAPQTLHVRDGPQVTEATALTFFNSDLTAGTAGLSDPTTYKCFTGGASNFPATSEWINFDAMFDLNQKDGLDLEQADSAAVQSAMYNSILEVSNDALIDPRFILAIIMQESSGNVDVLCTNNGIQNCGIMQASAGSVAFDPNNVQTSITQMIRDGTQGTFQGGVQTGGYVQILNEPESAGNVYNAARLYNSGSIDLEDLNDPKGATASYSNDVANRLLGWNGDGAGFASC